jgi:hypothetical protein
MKLTSLALALGAGFTAASATLVSAQSMPSPHNDDPNLINISCYRGPFETVAWDRPNSVFVEDLVQIGYTRDKAMVIGEHICRDEFGVRNPSHQIDQLRQILRDDPPGR